MKMKKFINKPENITKELLEGLALSNPETIELLDNNLVVNKKLKGSNRVAIVTLGGSGHEPAISGYVGDGMADISVVGDVFAAPSAGACLEAIKLADQGQGVLLVVLNHPGDMLAGNMTMKLAEKEGLNVIKVVTQEDIANAPRSDGENRRGLVGCVAVYKIAGAMAQAGKSLKEIAEVTQKFADNMATIAVAIRGATHPANGAVIGEFDDDDMEIGMGQHGEGGGGRSKMVSADEIATIMTDTLIKDLELKKGEKILTFVNGTGALTLLEQLIIFRKVKTYLQEKGIEISACKVGEILTVQEQAGFQLFFARMDDQLLKYWKAPCYTPYHREV